ncbi:hypothetical protein DPPLL_18460 [Desulfofustis limnaeus]|uniref:Uncharacterized protein n=1 Tax=Desulfofustis limnaeus TaxID=2740163 RepID=A0ABM7W9C8_9BACT|nr:hypothetical protein DPPLL_18460 [Desulfofustis limnaeus]
MHNRCYNPQGPNDNDLRATSDKNRFIRPKRTLSATGLCACTPKKNTLNPDEPEKKPNHQSVATPIQYQAGHQSKDDTLPECFTACSDDRAGS